MRPQSQAERSLLDQARQGDRDAQQTLWRMHRRWVAAIVLAHRPRSVDVDDLMQEVAVKFISKIQTLRDVGAFRPWLRQIVLNICRGAARGLKPTLHLAATERYDQNGRAETDVVATPQTAEASGHEVAEQRDAASRLMAHLLTLPPEYREPMLLRCVRSMSYQQISEMLDLPVTTIETRLARARRMLREEIGSLVGDNP
jgi:RNA polymerase sigma-70 factor (ECF subfamily)